MADLIDITPVIQWDNDKSLNDQDRQTYQWFIDNIWNEMSWYVPSEIKMNTARKLGYKETPPKSPKNDSKTQPVEWDGFARPKKWKIEHGDCLFNIEAIYLYKYVNWNLDRLNVIVNKKD